MHWKLSSLLAILLITLVCPHVYADGGDRGGAPPPTEGEVNTIGADGARPVPTGEFVTLNTTKGPIVLQLHPEWAPLATQRFLELVDAHFYNGAPWFRVIPGFVAQTGISTNPKLNAQWLENTIKDEPRQHSNLRGTVAFGKSGQPDSASTHIFISFADNSASLDRQGFAPFAEVVSGMEFADALSVISDKEIQLAGVNQMDLANLEGMRKFRKGFPEADYITRVYVGQPEVVTDRLDPRSPDFFEGPAAIYPLPTRVVLETTKGKIVLAVHRTWAPIGAPHFLRLVRLGFYDGAPWFRVIDRKDPNNPDAPALPFVAQCGIAVDPELNKQWGEANIQDDRVVMGNTRGRVAYGKTEEPNSRSTHIYINFGDNSRLDAKGFAAFAEVVEGMDVADSLYKCEFEDQDALTAPGGMAAFKALFPEADYILRAYVEGEG